MATTRLADIIEPAVYADYEAVNGPEKTAFFESGIVTRNPALDEKANSGGKILNVPFWKDLDATQEPNYSSDDPAVSATPQKVTSGEQIARIAYLNQGYSSADLAGEIAGSSPMQQVRNRFGTYWQRQWQRRIIAASEGLLADNIASNAGDMVNDIAIETGLSATAANLYSRAAFVATAFTLGDQFDSVEAIAVHSVIYQAMVDADDITFIRDSTGNLMFATYLGKRIIVDDGMSVVAGTTNGFKYTTILFGAGAFGFGEGSPEVPVEIERDAAQGTGGGVETLWERKTWLLHPLGFTFNSTTVAGNSATLAEMKLAANWTRVIERKNVPVAFLRTNG